MIFAVTNLAVFIFVMTAVVYETQQGRNPQIANYADSLYFTVTALTTTGFGDIVMEGPYARLLAVLLFVTGLVVAIVLGLLQRSLRSEPTKWTRMAKEAMRSLEDLDLAWLVQGTPEFVAYVTDMVWAQEYARANRDQMMDAAMSEVFAVLGLGRETRRINAHHNFTQLEVHDGRELWVTDATPDARSTSTWLRRRRSMSSPSVSASSGLSGVCRP